MSVTLTGSGNTEFRAYRTAEAIPVERTVEWGGTAGATEDNVDGDATIRTTAIGNSAPRFVFTLGLPLETEYEVENLTPTVLENVGTDGVQVSCTVISGQEEIAGALQVTANGFPARKLGNLFAPAAATTSTERVVELTDGSLADAARDSIVADAVGWSGATEYYAASVPSAALNAACWAADYDLRALAMDTSQGGFFGARGGSLVTRRHAVCALHYPIKLGATLYFHGGQSAKVIGVGACDANDPAVCDVQVVTLDKAISGPINPFKVPSTMGGRIKARWTGAPPGPPAGYGGLGMAFVGNGRKVVPWLIREDVGRPDDGRNYDVDGVDFRAQMRIAYSSHLYFDGERYPDRNPLWWAGGSVARAVGGDSGGPVLFVVDGEVLLHSFFTGTGNGPSFFGAAGLLNALIAKADGNAGLSTGLTVTEHDISGFPEY